MSDTTSTTSTAVTVAYMGDSTYQAHKAGCRDLARMNQVELETGEYTSHQHIIETYFGHQMEENDATWNEYASEIRIMPCVKFGK